MPDRLDALGRCHGYLAVANDGPVGTVETPLFPPDVDEPDYIVVRIQQGLRSRLPVVTAALVERVDPLRRLVYLRASGVEVAGQPEHLPLAI